MRIATSTAYSQAVTSMNNQNYKLNKTMLQLSTGKKITVPSDDPAGASRVLGLNQAKARTEQFQKNIITVKSSLEAEETTLSGIVDGLQRIRELSLQANNDTYDSEQRRDISFEIKEQMDAIIGLANSTNGNGEYLFGGFNNRQTPFVKANDANNVLTARYQGDHGQQFLQVSATRQVASGDNGFDLFMNVRGTQKLDPADDSPTTLFTAVGELEKVLRTNQGLVEPPPPAAATTTETFHESMSRIISNIDVALGHVVDARSAIGARQNATDSQQSVNEDFLIQVASTLSDTQDLDYTLAISNLEQQQLGFQASQQTFTKIQGLSLFNFL
jgi:flagellar hook-associated protein 3 FlgL